MPVARPIREVEEVLELLSEHRPTAEVSRITGVPVTTIRNWRRGRLPLSARRALAGIESCEQCGSESHDFASLDGPKYSYLLGLYLGDGCLSETERTIALRISLDTAYPWIILSCQDAIEDLVGKRPSAVPKRGENCVTVVSYGRIWGCLFPQHGRGRKHERKIALEPWQQAVVDREPEAFLRGLIHSDGWRGLNRVTAKGRPYAYPRYQFSNRSADIRKLFTATCDRLGVEWRPWGPWHISIARRHSVAKFDTFIGPKC